MRNKTTATLLLILIAHGAFAQQASRFGSDEEECGKNYTIYYEHYKLKEYDQALPFWKKTVEICPAFSVTLWKTGEKMYKDRLEKASAEKDRQACLDTLLWIYDQRIEHFGNDPRAGKGFVLGKKGVARMTYSDKQTKEAYEDLQTAVSLEQLNTKADVLYQLVNAAVLLYDEGAIDEADVLTSYEQTQEVLEYGLKNTPGDPVLTQVREGVENLFIRSGAASCESLIRLYENQFDVQQNNLDWVRKANRQLRRSVCTDHDFYIRVTQRMVELEPTASDAHMLGQLYLRNERYEEAIPWLMQSRELGLPDEEMAEAAYELAYIHFIHLKDYPVARDFAQEACRIRPGWGDPWLLTGRIYADGREDAFSDEFDQATALWAAVDQFIQAKTVDPSTETQANNLIQTWSALFPSTETLFYHTLKKGDPYQVKSWINETTTVRSRD